MALIVNSAIEFNLKRYHVFVMFMLFTATGPMQISNQLFPAFNNVIPEWRCGNHTGFSRDCSIITNCTSDNYSNQTQLEFRNVYLDLAEDLELYCDQAVYMPIIGSLQMAGLVVGSLLFGQLSDRFGRKPISLICMTGLLIFSTLTTFLYDWLLVALARFLTAVFMAGQIVGCQTLMIESIETQHRILAFAFFRGSGYGRLAYVLATYCLGDWRVALRVINISSIVVPIIVLFAIQESPRWVSQQADSAKLQKVMRKINKFNGEQWDTELVPKYKSRLQRPATTKQTNSYAAIFSSATLRKRAFLASYFFFTCAFINYGFDMTSGSLAGNFFLKHCLTGAVIQLIKPLVFFVDTYVPKFSRRLFHQVSLGPVVLMLIPIVFLSLAKQLPGVDMSITVLAIAGRCLIEYQWDAVILYGLELFPTVVRNSAFAFAATFGRLGDTLAPQVAYLSVFWPPASYLVFAIVGIMSIVLSMAFAPDTKGIELSDTLQLENEGDYLMKELGDSHKDKT